jgi:3-oxoacyl-[acyl-carrier protein] reductase
LNAQPADGGLPQRTALVINAGLDMSPALLAGLQVQGIRVVLLTDNAEAARARPDGVHRVSLTPGSRAAVQAAFDAAVAEAGAPDLVVLCVMPELSVRLTELADLPEPDWFVSVRETIRTTLHLLQVIAPVLRERGGSVIFLAPSLSLTGCAGLVALTTALEGQRGLMKSVARQWGSTGVTLNWVAVTPAALSPVFARAPLAIKADAVPVALGRALDLASEVVPVITFLASAAGRKMTGATLCLDGGEWMLP